MSEFGGVWKRHNKPVYTKIVESLHNVEVGHYTKEEKKKSAGLAGHIKYKSTYPKTSWKSQTDSDTVTASLLHYY